MGLQPKKIGLFLGFIFLSVLLVACSATPTLQPPPTPTTDAVTIPPRSTATATATATAEPSPTSGTATVLVATVNPLTSGATVAGVPTNTTAPTNTATPRATTAPAAGATTAPPSAATPARTNTPGRATATPTRNVPTPVASPAPSPSSLAPGGKLAIIREDEVLVYSLPQTSPDSVKLGKAVDVAWSPEGNWLVALDKGEVRIWDVNANNVRTVKISESGDRLVVSAKANYAVLAASTQTGYTAKVLNLNTGTVVSNDTLQIGGIGAIIMAGWHPTEPVLAYTATENQAADLVMIDVNENGLKSNTIKPDFGLSYRFVRWLRNEAIVAKLDLKSPAERAVKDVVKVSRSANLVTLKNSELGVELDNNTLRLIPPSVVPEDDKRGLRLTYASNLRFAAFSAYSSKTKSNQIFILGIYSSNLGDIQPFGAGTVAAWQSRVPNE